MGGNSASIGHPVMSVITVCYNEPPEKVRKTFESIASQDHPRIEWIVVDGGSGEDTLAAIREFADKIDVLISEPDKGIYDAMNKGVARATGDLINFMNVGDRFVASSVVSSVVDSISSRPGFDCYYGDMVYVDEESNPILVAYQLPRVNIRRLYSRTVCHQAIFASRRLFREIGAFDLQYPLAADRDWIIRTLKVRARWLHTGIMIGEYEVGGASGDVVKSSTETSRLIRNWYCPWERACLYLHLKATRVIVRLSSCLRTAGRGA